MIFACDVCLYCHNASYHLLSERAPFTLEELRPENRSRAGTIELERWATSSVCVYVIFLVCGAI